jgi:hypothetical protein
MKGATMTGLLIILITEAALSASHMVYSNPWWRQPFMGSDRWHCLSFLSHVPAAIYILWGEPWWLWITTATLSFIIWQVNKKLTGKSHWGVWYFKIARRIYAYFRGS